MERDNMPKQPKNKPDISKPLTTSILSDAARKVFKNEDNVGDMPTDPREVNGTTQKKQGIGLKTALLRGRPGSGKTRFYLKDLWRAVGEAYKQLTGKKLDWSDYHNWTQQIRGDVREASKRCLMCIIDMDYQGTDDLIARDSVVPPEIASAIFVMGVSGLGHKDGIKFYEAIDIRNHFLRKLEWHNKKYPENRGQRFLVLDNTGELYKDTLDKYFYDTSGGEIKSMREKMQRDEAENYKRGKDEKWKVQSGEKKTKKVALFQSGQRDTFRVIDSDYRGFFRDILAAKPVLGFNFYVTTHVIQYTKEEGDGDDKVKVTKEFADGRADDFLAGYFNLVLTFNKDVKYKTDTRGRVVNVEIGKFYVDTIVGAKNRLSPDIFFDITGKGAIEFYEELERKRDEEEGEFTRGNKKASTG